MKTILHSKYIFLGSVGSPMGEGGIWGGSWRDPMEGGPNEDLDKFFSSKTPSVAPIQDENNAAQ